MTYEKTINPDLSDDPKGIVIKFPITKSRPSRNGNDFRAGGGDHHHPPCGLGLNQFYFIKRQVEGNEKISNCIQNTKQ